MEALVEVGERAGALGLVDIEAFELGLEILLNALEGGDLGVSDALAGDARRLTFDLGAQIVDVTHLVAGVRAHAHPANHPSDQVLSLELE